LPTAGSLRFASECPVEQPEKDVARGERRVFKEHEQATCARRAARSALSIHVKAAASPCNASRGTPSRRGLSRRGWCTKTPYASRDKEVADEWASSSRRERARERERERRRETRRLRNYTPPWMPTVGEKQLRRGQASCEDPNRRAVCDAAFTTVKVKSRAALVNSAAICWRASVASAAPVVVMVA